MIPLLGHFSAWLLATINSNNYHSIEHLELFCLYDKLCHLIHYYGQNLLQWQLSNTDNALIKGQYMPYLSLASSLHFINVKDFNIQHFNMFFMYHNKSISSHLHDVRWAQHVCMLTL